MQTVAASPVTGSTEDPEAPYGRKDDGTPYKRSAEWRAAAGQAMSKGRTRASSAKPAPRKATGGKPAAPSYAAAVESLLVLPAFALQISARWRPVNALHAMAITYHAPSLAKAAETIAMDEPRMAAMLERVGQVGPYGAFVIAAIPLALQVLCNEGMVAPSPERDVYAPDDLMRKLGVEVKDADHGPAGHDPA